MMVFFVDDRPVGIVELWEIRIAGELLVDSGHVDAVRQRQSEPVDLGTASDKDLLVTCSPFSDEDGRLIGSVHVARDKIGRASCRERV